MSDTAEQPVQDRPEWATTMWGAHRAQALAELAALNKPRPLTIEERLRRLEDEREITAVFHRYHIFYSSGDVENILSCFTPDAVQINGRGTFIGHDSLRENYRWLTSHQKMIIHYGTNLHVTFDDDDPDRGLLTARFLAARVTWQDTFDMCGGLYTNKMVRTDGRWFISHQRITLNYLYRVPLSRRVVGPDAPVPDAPVSQRDLIEERYLHA